MGIENPLGIVAPPLWGDEASFNRWAAWVNQSATFTQQGIVREVHSSYCVVSPLRNLTAKLHCAIPPIYRGSGMYAVDCIVTFKNVVGGSDVGTDHILEFCDCGWAPTTSPPPTTVPPTTTPAPTTPPPTTPPPTTVPPTTTWPPTTVPPTTPPPTTVPPTTTTTTTTIPPTTPPPTTLPPWTTTTTTTTTLPPTTTEDPVLAYCCDGETVAPKTLFAELQSDCDDATVGCPGSSTLEWDSGGNYWEGPFPKPAYVAADWSLRIWCSGGQMLWAPYENGIQAQSPQVVNSYTCNPFEVVIDYFEGGALLCCGGIETVKITITA